MDELFDFADLFDLLQDSPELDLLSDDGIHALAQLLDGADYIEIGPGFLSALAAIDPEHFDQLAGTVDWTGFWDGFNAGSFSELDTGWIDTTTFLFNSNLDVSEVALGFDAVSAVDPSLVAEQFSGAIASVPPVFLSGIQSLEWDPSLLTEAPGTMGRWIAQVGADGSLSSSIQLFDHASDVIATTYHEVGHNIAGNFPAFFEEFAAASSGSPEFWDHFSGFLSLYPEDVVLDEAFAEAISAYNTQPELLKALAPKIFGVVDAWWVEASRA